MLVAKEAGPPLAVDGRRRRRLWSTDEKRRIVAETLAPGASVSVVARRHDLNANMLFTWRREVGGVTSPVADETVTFVPATITDASGTAVSARSPVTVGGMEIVLGGGDRIIVGADVDAAALARVVKVLSRR
jgi:transposase